MAYERKSCHKKYFDLSSLSFIAQEKVVIKIRREKRKFNFLFDVLIGHAFIIVTLELRTYLCFIKSFCFYVKIFSTGFCNLNS